MMKTNEDCVEMVLSIDESRILSYKIKNTGTNSLLVRDLAYDDFIIVGPSDTVAQPAIRSSFGYGVPRRQLEPHQEFGGSIHILTEYLFPKAGKYKIFVKYDAQRNTAKWQGNADLSPVIAFSNTVAVDIANEDVREPFRNTMDIKEFRERVKACVKPWWKFW